MSPLRKGGDFLPASSEGFVLATQSLDTLTRTGLANLSDHKISTPTKSGVNLFALALATLAKSLAIELQNLLATDRAVDTIRKGRLVRDCDAEKAQPSLTLGVFDDLELGSHNLFSSWL
jgi:hypothetical protein